MRDITAAGIETVKRIAQGLRAPLLEDLGLGPAVERLCDEAAATHGLEVAARIELASGTRFSEQLELGVYRLVQEALTNVVRHADATEASVTLRLTGEALEVSVADNGKGMRIQPGPARGMGLQGMRERVLLLGGTMSIRSTPGSGTTILIRLPLSEAANDSNSRPHRG
jgi:signal transduction histidine kinase